MRLLHDHRLFSEGAPEQRAERLYDGDSARLGARPDHRRRGGPDRQPDAARAAVPCSGRSPLAADLPGRGSSGSADRTAAAHVARAGAPRVAAGLDGGPARNSICARSRSPERWRSALGLSVDHRCQATCNYVLLGWGPTFFERLHHWPKDRTGLVLGTDDARLRLHRPVYRRLALGPLAEPAG